MGGGERLAMRREDVVVSVGGATIFFLFNFLIIFKLNTVKLKLIKWMSVKFLKMKCQILSRQIIGMA